jgi:hypothetical protein
MVIFQINVDGIAFDPTKRNAPVSTGAEGIPSFISTNERMKAEPRQIHVLWSRCIIERSQNIGYASRILHAEPPPIAGCKKPFKGFVAKRTDHARM